MTLRNYKSLTPERAQHLIAEFTREVQSPELCPAPLVSVCIITFNHECFVRQTIEGVLSQETPFPFEILISDDNSTDGTTEIVREYQKLHPDRIRLMLGIENLGKYTGTGRLNLLRALESARGKYIAQCEGDDYWNDDNKLADQVGFLESNPDYVACFSQAAIEFHGHEDARLVTRFAQEKTDYAPEEILGMGTHAATASLVFRNHLITPPPFPMWFYNVAYADRPLRGMLAKFGKFHCLPRKTCVYRCNNWGAMANTLRGNMGEINRLTSGYRIFEGLRIYHEGNHESLLCRNRDEMGASAFEALCNVGHLSALRYFLSWWRYHTDYHKARRFIHVSKKLACLIKRKCKRTLTTTKTS